MRFREKKNTFKRPIQKGWVRKFFSHYLRRIFSEGKLKGYKLIERRTVQMQLYSKWSERCVEEVWLFYINFQSLFFKLNTRCEINIEEYKPSKLIKLSVFINDNLKSGSIN